MNSDKKKRLIIPVATLMVAIVMMAGVGYAAVSSTFTVDGNTTAGGEFKVTINDYVDGKLFTNAKIPYGVNTTNGTTVNTVYADKYVLVEDKTVKVTDNTGLNKDYKVTATATSETIVTKLGAGCTLNAILLKSEATSEATGTYRGEQTFTLKVVLNVVNNVNVTNLENLELKDITVTITAEHTP